MSVMPFAVKFPYLEYFGVRKGGGGGRRRKKEEQGTCLFCDTRYL